MTAGKSVGAISWLMIGVDETSLGVHSLGVQVVLSYIKKQACRTGRGGPLWVMDSGQHRGRYEGPGLGQELWLVPKTI